MHLALRYHPSEWRAGIHVRDATMPDTPWHERDDFWHGWGTRTEVTGEEIDAVIKLLSVADAGHILDLACGSGRHAVALAKRGYRVTGVDRTQQFLDNAQRAADDESVEVELVNADMREFRREDAFDGALILFTSFGYFDDPADDIRVIENVCAGLRPGARLIIDVKGKENVTQIFTAREWHEEPDGTLQLWERWIERDWSMIATRRIVIAPDGSRDTMKFSHRLYSAMELSTLLRDVGFGDIEVYGHLVTQAPYDQNARRLVVVGRKPASEST